MSNSTILYDKPFKTLEEQIIYLIENKGISVLDHDFAMDILATIPYHTLINGYKDLYATNDIFEDNTSLEVLFLTHIIHSSINSILFKYIIHIENSLTSKLGYYISESYGVETNKIRLEYGEDILVSEETNDYLNINNYLGSYHTRESIIKNFVKLCRRPYRDSLINHYVSTKNHLPPWVLANDLSFGKTYEWYSILNGTIKTLVTDNFYPKDSKLSSNEKKEFFNAAMKQLIQFRDRVAHGNKTVELKFHKKLPVQPTLKLVNNETILVKEEMLSSLGSDDFYSIILSTTLMLNNSFYATTFVDDLLSLFDSYKTNDFSGKNLFEILKLPENIEERLLNLLLSYYEI